MDNFSQSQYGSDAYNLSMQGTPSYSPQPEYGQSDYRNMYGNVPQYEDNTSLPMTMEDAEEESGGIRGRFGKKKSNKQPSNGDKKGLPTIVIIVVLVLIILGGGFLAMKMGILPNPFGGNNGGGGQQPATTNTSNGTENSGTSANTADSVFIGTWKLCSLQEGTTTYDKDKIQSIAKGDEGYLLLFDDGTMQMKLIGDGSALEGTWKALNEKEAELNIGGTDKISAVCENNILKLQYKNTAVEFEKTANTATPISESNTNSNSGSLLGGNTNSNTNSNTNTNTNTTTNTNTNTSTSSNTEQPQTNTGTSGGDAGGGSTGGGGGFVDVD